MKPILHFDQATLANLAAALDYACRQLPQDRDTPAVRPYIADQIVEAANKGASSLHDLPSVALSVVNSYVFPPNFFSQRVTPHQAANPHRCTDLLPIQRVCWLAARPRFDGKLSCRIPRSS